MKYRLPFIMMIAIVGHDSTMAMNSALVRITPYAMPIARETVTIGKIVGGSIGAACLYGVVNDQVTARICPAYFNKGFHRANTEGMSESWLKRQLRSDSPTRLGFSWGILATWWMGALLSVPVTLASRLGPAPRLGMNDLVLPTAAALLLMGAGSAYEGWKGYQRACKMGTDHKNDLQRTCYHVPDLSSDEFNNFYADAKAHEAGYKYGTLAGLGMTAFAIGKRLLMAFHK